MPLNAPPPRYLHPSQIPTFVRVVFPNGSTYDADTCEEMENYIKSLRWEFFWDHQHFRETVSKETLERSWGELEIDTDGTSRDFLQEMERAGYFTLGLHFEPKENNAHDPWE
jgi:hypothetical protein